MQETEDFVAFNECLVGFIDAEFNLTLTWLRLHEQLCFILLTY